VRANLTLIDSQIRALFPKDDIRLSQANGSVVISGSVSDQRIATQADAVVQAAGFKTVNMLTSPVKDVVQVQLMVRVAEVNKNRIRELGASYSYQATLAREVLLTAAGPGQCRQCYGRNSKRLACQFAEPIDHGREHSLDDPRSATTGSTTGIAEPNLIAMSGQEASFLAGGEFPVPIVQGGAAGSAPSVSIVFKEYGVRLNFKPTVLDEDHIRLELEPEVSTLDFANGVKFNGFLIPGLRTRRAKTGG